MAPMRYEWQVKELAGRHGRPAVQRTRPIARPAVPQPRSQGKDTASPPL